MKKVRFIFFLIIFTNLSYASFTYNELIINKNTSELDSTGFTGYMTVKHWCLKVGSAFDFGSFQAAKDLEKFEDGLYRCKGEFTKLPYSPVKVFKIKDCSLIDIEEFRKECK